jgi:hypothetical protein
MNCGISIAAGYKEATMQTAWRSEEKSTFLYLFRTTTFSKLASIFSGNN